MIQIKDGKKEYILESYSNGIRFYPKGTTSTKKQFVNKKILKVVYEKIRAEGSIKLNIPPEMRSWIPELGKKKSILYEVGRILRALFPNKFVLDKGVLVSQEKIKPFDEVYSEAHSILFSRSPNEVLDISHTASPQGTKRVKIKYPKRKTRKNLNKQMQTQTILETVEVEYHYRCPHCGFVNTRPYKCKRVVCSRCFNVFEVERR